MNPLLPKLLIIEDDEGIRSQMKWALAQDHEVLTAGDAAEARIAFAAAHPPVVLLDLGLPPRPADPSEGLAILNELLALDPLTKVVIISGQGERPNALSAIGAGACDFLCKPVDLEELRRLLQRCYYVAALEREYRELRQRVGSAGLEGMLGNSPPMQAVFALLRKVAANDASVLILGESGTGKEMAARAIHALSPRKDGPFTAINCGAIPETLLESELFGHEKGAFTGAHTQTRGRIELAQNGTLFLDEIGDVPPTVQVKLLRFLQDKRIERVGGRQELVIDARVIAATNANLKQKMAQGAFREDLFYRLAVVQLALPPLRERDTDIRLLAQLFLQKFSAPLGKSGLTFDMESFRALDRHSWPGNIRELENRVRRAAIMAEGRRVTPADLELTEPLELRRATLKEAREDLEAHMVQHALRKHSGKITPAAAELGISRPTFYELMDKLAIARD